MAITPPSDIVLDVARAADPEKYRMAAERLARLRATAPSTETFMPPADRARVVTPTDVTSTAAAPARPLDAGARVQSRRRLDPYGQFEAFVLQSFVQSMLPRTPPPCSARAARENSGDRCLRRRWATSSPAVARSELPGDWPLARAIHSARNGCDGKPNGGSAAAGDHTCRPAIGRSRKCRTDAAIPAIEPASERS